MKRLKLDTFLPWLLIAGGLIGLAAASIISYDKQQLLKDPSFQPSCNLNPVISCGNIMASKQGEAFGFPNPWIGLVAFGVLITIGVSLLAGAHFKRWFWLGLQAGTLFGLLFVYWLIFQSLYRIGALCPYCMAVWVVVIGIFWYVLLYNLQQGNLCSPDKLKPLANFMRRHHLDILMLWLLLITVLILKRFWYFFNPF
jgi:uncharacterized membrane protein